MRSKPIGGRHDQIPTPVADAQAAKNGVIVFVRSSIVATVRTQMAAVEPGGANSFSAAFCLSSNPTCTIAAADWYAMRDDMESAKEAAVKTRVRNASQAGNAVIYLDNGNKLTWNGSIWVNDGVRRSRAQILSDMGVVLPRP